MTRKVLPMMIAAFFMIIFAAAVHRGKARAETCTMHVVVTQGGSFIGKCRGACNVGPCTTDFVDLGGGVTSFDCDCDGALPDSCSGTVYVDISGNTPTYTVSCIINGACGAVFDCDPTGALSPSPVCSCQ